MSQVRLDFRGAFHQWKKGICSESVRNVGTSGAVFATTEGTRRKLRLAELEESLAVTSKSPAKVGGASEGYYR